MDIKPQGGAQRRELAHTDFLNGPVLDRRDRGSTHTERFRKLALGAPGSPTRSAYGDPNGFKMHY
jgi:hypothetical protein